MSEKDNAEELIIDPHAMNIVNRVAPGSNCAGQFKYEGGVLVQGRLEGSIEVTGGPRVLMPEGAIVGDINVKGEAYLFGTILEKSPGEMSEVDVNDAVFLANSLKADANITAGAIKSYEGALVNGRIRTVRRSA